jgi:3-hydroxy-D-aspartate aldolase
MTDAAVPNLVFVEHRDLPSRVTTPALIVNLSAFDRNLTEMAQRAVKAGRGLRPHIKGPKCPEVARRQIAAGASGISCATLFEAETMAAAGIPNLLLTSPVIGEARLRRLTAIDALCDGGVAAVIDHADGLEQLAAAATRAGRRINVLIDLDVGQRRTGVGDAASAVELAHAIARHRSLAFRGLQGYYGHLQGLQNFTERQAACKEAMAHIARVIDALRNAGLPPQIVTGGGTGSCAIDLAADTFTEIQPGSYPFMDTAYAAVDIAGDGSTVFDVALFVEAEVVSANVAGQVTINAGMKAIPTDGGPVRIASGAPKGSIFRHAGDEFGVVSWPDPAAQGPRLGDRLRIVTGHCDTTCNLYADLHVMKEDGLVEVWPITARSRW